MLNGSKTFIICEFSQTHEGSMPVAKMLAKAAAAAGADAVKVQVFSADELAVPAYDYYGLFKSLEWTSEQWKELIDYCHEQGIQFYADVFGTDSAMMLAENGVDGLKVHGTDMRNSRLLKCLADIDLPLLLSIGGGTVDEVRNALNLLRYKDRKNPVVIMHGIQSYPTLVEHTNFDKMRYAKDELGLSVGFADHIDGDHQLNFALCAMAVGVGASVIEKHITIARSLKMEDYESALSPDGFVKFVENIRSLDSAKGEYSDRLNDVEENYRQATRKHVVAAEPIEAGQTIGEQSVVLRRAKSDKQASDLDCVIGRKAKKSYNLNDVLVVEELA